MTRSAVSNREFLAPGNGQNSHSQMPPRRLREFAAAAGVTFNGSLPWDIQVHDSAVYREILLRGSLGFGEAYMDGLWDAERLAY